MKNQQGRKQIQVLVFPRFTAQAFSRIVTKERSIDR
jgi:hypothetical protein